MHALAEILQVLDQPGGDLKALSGLLLGLGHLLDQVFGHEDPRHVLVHVAGHTYGFQGDDSREDRDPKLLGPLHEAGKGIHVVHRLGLEEPGPCLHLLLHLYQLELEGGIGIGDRGNDSPDEEIGLALQLVPC